MEQLDCVVIGAGVIGIAVARALAQAGREVLVLEAAAAIGTETSSRNSEVIHAGIYYPQDSLMARLCVAGRRQLIAYCAERPVPFQLCGKLIVATSAAQTEQLPAIRARAEANGVQGLRVLSAGMAREFEPDLVCTAALLSPATGILDSHAYMLALQADAEAAGAMFVFHAPFVAARVVDSGFEVEVGGSEPMRIGCGRLINAAGLKACDVAGAITGLAPGHVPRCWYAKGTYFSLEGKSPFQHLIYPVPVAGGLGVHLTLDLGGQARFGPDVQWVDTVEYSVDAGRAAGFYAAVRRYWPELRDGALLPAYCGIRPKLAPKGSPAMDFVIAGPREHGVPGLVNLFGIESPGLTSSMALAELVRELALNAARSDRSA